MTLKEHAIQEFKAAGWYALDDAMQKMAMANLLELLSVFGKQGHSGSSAPYVLKAFKKLAAYEPLVPLEGTEDEWKDVGYGTYQNKRCGHVFKSADRFEGRAYDTEAVIFYDVLDNGDRSYYTNSGSARPIKFPYMPERIYEESKI